MRTDRRIPELCSPMLMPDEDRRTISLRWKDPAVAYSGCGGSSGALPDVQAYFKARFRLINLLSEQLQRRPGGQYLVICFPKRGVQAFVMRYIDNRICPKWASRVDELNSPALLGASKCVADRV